MLEQEIKTKLPTTSKPALPKLDSFFDALEYIVERLESLVWKSKYLLFGLGFLLFLIYELAHFGKFLLKNWNG